MLDLKLYIYISTVEVVSNFNSVILNYDLCILPRKILLTENCIVTSLLEDNNNNDKTLFLINVISFY